MVSVQGTFDLLLRLLRAFDQELQARHRDVKTIIEVGIGAFLVVLARILSVVPEILDNFLCLLTSGTVSKARCIVTMSTNDEINLEEQKAYAQTDVLVHAGHVRAEALEKNASRRISLQVKADQSPVVL